MNKITEQKIEWKPQTRQKSANGTLGGERYLKQENEPRINHKISAFCCATFFLVGGIG